MRDLYGILKQTAKESIGAMAEFARFIGAACLLILPFLVIPWIAEAVAYWLLILYIPYFLFLPLLAKPLTRFFEE